ncbi:hypothetical protein [Mesorhizobium sp. M0684]|uniref:hypothetical protein n=1 Tax=Mesorhizobium sp. M0684 TaxID=2956986 RepID=UPI00333894DF
MAKDDRERAEAFKVVSADQEVSREIATFRKSIEARFGEDGAREIARATASGTTFEHPSVPKSEHGRLGEAARSILQPDPVKSRPRDRPELSVLQRESLSRHG